MLVTKPRLVGSVGGRASYLYGVNDKNQTVAVPVVDTTVAPSGGDDALVIASRIAALGSGNGTIGLAPGTYNLATELQIPPYVNLWGAGIGVTVFQSSGANGRINFIRGSSDGRGGTSGNFSIRGAHIATNPLKLGIVVERTFIAIDVQNSDGDGMLIEGAQNCTFLGVHSQNNNGANLVLDYGAGNNRFSSCEFSKAGGYGIKFQQSGTSDAAVFAVPTSNRFVGCIVERMGWNDGAASPDTATGLIYHGAGRMNSFAHCDFAAEALTTAKILALIEKAGSDESLLVQFHDCVWGGTATYTTAIELRANTSACFSGTHLMENHTKAFSVADSASVVGTFHVNLGTVTTYYANQGGGTQPQVNRMQSVSRSRLRSVVPLDTIGISVGADGDSLDSTEIYPRGIFRGGAGSGASDVSMQRQSKYSIVGWKMDNPAGDATAFVMSLGPVDLIIASGAPTQSASNGSLYLRTDNNGQLYQRRSGAWASI